MSMTGQPADPVQCHHCVSALDRFVGCDRVDVLRSSHCDPDGMQRLSLEVRGHADVSVRDHPHGVSAGHRRSGAHRNRAPTSGGPLGPTSRTCCSSVVDRRSHEVTDRIHGVNLGGRALDIRARRPGPGSSPRRASTRTTCPNAKRTVAQLARKNRPWRATPHGAPVRSQPRTRAPGRIRFDWASTPCHHRRGASTRTRSTASCASAPILSASAMGARFSAGRTFGLGLTVRKAA